MGHINRKEINGVSAQMKQQTDQIHWTRTMHDVCSHRNLAAYDSRMLTDTLYRPTNCVAPRFPHSNHRYTIISCRLPTRNLLLGLYYYCYYYSSATRQFSVVLTAFHTSTTLGPRRVAGGGKSPWCVTSHPGQLSLVPLVGWKMSTGQNAATSCGWEVKASNVNSSYELNAWVAGKTLRFLVKMFHIWEP